MIKIGKWTIDYNPKPIPTRDFDYDVIHEEYDMDNGDYFFNAKSVIHARREIEIRDTVLEKEEQ